MNDPMAYVVILFAITALAGLEITALLNGVDGTVYSLVISAITALAGYAIGKNINKPFGG